MQKFNKLSRNTRPQEQPKGTYPFGKNGVQNYIEGATLNEMGFAKSAAILPYTQIGIIETDKYPVIFSSNNVHSAIGYFDVDNDIYIPKYDDASLPFKLPFDTDFYITGQAQRNYKGELVVAFTDKNATPFYVNMDTPMANTLNDLKLFPNALPADLTIEVQAGGILLPGAYYAALKYTKKDGTETSYIAVSAPAVVSGTTGQATDKSLEITLTNIDPDYDYVQIAIVTKINGILSAVQFLNPILASGSITIAYTGTEVTEPVTLEEILTPRKVYNKVGTMGQLNDALYIADLESPQQIRMQKWVNLIRLKWHSKLITVNPVYTPMSEGKEKSHMHGEVYAWYIRFKKTDGTVTQSFVIPGEPLDSTDRLTSPLATAEGLTAKKFQVEDRIPSFDYASKSGYFGKWENASENYPNTDDFNSSAVGGEDLRGTPVRHHRFPSIAWCKQNLFMGEPDYGRNSLDMLGISLENVTIPAEYADQIVGWELFYAKRNVANSTIVGQSLMLNGARNQAETALSPSNYYSTGGNWNSYIDWKSGPDYHLYMDQSIFHFHSFDMLFNNPSVTPDYIDLQLKHSRVNFPYTGGTVEDQLVTDSNDGPMVFVLDYLQKGISPVLPAKRIKAVADTSWVPNNIEYLKWHNKGIERFFGGRFTHPEALISSGDVYELTVQPGSRHPYTGPEAQPKSETCFLSNMMSIKSQLFVPFTAQSLVRGGSSNTVNNTEIFYGGDIYICDYSFHTYGWFDNENQVSPYNGMFQGTKVVRRFICECVANLYARYEDPANPYSRYYPKSSLTPNDKDNYLTNFMRDIDPNQFGYKKDSNALDDLFATDIFNTFAEDLYLHPYRIHRMGKLSRQTKVRNWRSCLPLDYYEMQKNMGKPVHLEGMDDRLLIHCENALFRTQDKTKLEADIISITLGSGDIFQFEPQEANSAPRGYAGTQHDLACVRTPNGYIFLDSKEGNIFIYKGQLELINKEMNVFFKEYLRMKENNPFIGNGYTIGYDPKYKRLLLTAKDVRANAGLIVNNYDPANILTYSIGDLLLKDGKLVRFLGVNSTVYNCDAAPVPGVPDLELTISENTAVGTLIGTLAGSNIVNYYITGSSSPFAIDPSTGKVTVVGSLDYYTQSLYTFAGKGFGTAGDFDGFTLIVHLTSVNRPPVILNNEVTISETNLDGDSVALMVATDREGDTLTFGIAGGNTGGTFTINPATGAITIADHTQLDGNTIPTYVLDITVTDGTTLVHGTCIVHITPADGVIVMPDTTITIPDTTPSLTPVVTLGPALVREDLSLTYTLISESVPGVFTVDLTTLVITLVNNSSLNPIVTPQYLLHMSVSGSGLPPVLFTVTINVEYTRGSIGFSPAVPSCLSGTPSCPSGYTLSSDGSACVKTTTTAATIISSGGCLAASTNSAYGSYFARIYKPGWNNSSIELFTAPTSDVYAEMSTTYWKGRPNACGVWVDSDCNGTPDALTAGAQTTISAYYNNTGSARTVYVGIFGDNEFELKVNGVRIAITDGLGTHESFKVFHIFPVDIINGANIFNAVGTGDGSVNDSIGMIIYDNTPATIQAATTDAGVTILYTTTSMINQPNVVATCPSGYVLDLTGSPSCKKIETVVPTGATNTRHWDKVQINDLRHSTIINIVNNQLTPILTFQDMNVPYYPDIANHIDCGATVVTYLSAAASGTVQKNDCTTGVGSVVTYTVPQGTYMSIVSQAAADALAVADVAANKQTYANTKGTCS